MKLKNNTLTKIKKNRKLVRALEDLHKKAPHTMQMWLNPNKQSSKLCHINSLNLIATYLDSDINSLLDKTKTDLPIGS